MPDKSKYTNRELSWLSFNDRVLQEADDKRVPLLERVKFLGIYSSNSDEFFRVRVASLRRMADIDGETREILGFKPKKVLKKIQETVINQRSNFDRIYAEVLTDLAGEGIFIISEKQLSEEQGAYVRAYFDEMVRPMLVPIMLDYAPAMPTLRDKIIYLAIVLTKGEGKGARRKHAIIEMPTDVLSRFVVLPSPDNNHYIMLLDDVIRYCLDEIFAVFKYDTAEAYTIKLTRDAELDIDEDISESFLNKMTKSLKQRKKGRLVRFIYDQEMPQEFLKFISHKLHLRKDDNLIPGGRYHNFKDFIGFPNVGPKSLHYEAMPPLQHWYMSPDQNLFEVIRKKDILFHYPYQSFHYVIDLLREAAIDPQVVSIKMTLYRLAQNSNVVNALINAVKNGKMVTVVMELQARFDEEANIFWANRLREEGAKVIFGMPGMKVHAKLLLISRKERGEAVRYAYIGTGNFNEMTARLYCDHGLYTADKHITAEVNSVFSFLDNNLRIGNYRHLLMAPFFMRHGLVGLINKEISNVKAKSPKPAYIILKLNNLVDPEMIDKLYEASQAGVKIRLIIRGTCSLKPGLPDLSENIEVISIVDRFLEHSRIFVFANGGEEKIYFGSADWMSRNLDHRIEVLCPVYDKDIQQELRAYLYLQMADNVKARIIDKDQSNIYRLPQPGQKKVRSQYVFYEAIKASQLDGPQTFRMLEDSFRINEEAI